MSKVSKRRHSTVELGHLSICSAHLVNPGKALQNNFAGGTLPVSGIAHLSADEVTQWRHLMKMWPSSYFKTACGRPTILSLIVPHISWGLLSAPLHMTSFCSKGRDAQASSMTANCRCIFRERQRFSVGDFMNEPTLQVCFCSCVLLLMKLNRHLWG